MLPTVLASFLFILLLSMITLYGYRAYVRPSRIYDRVGGTAESLREPGSSPRERMVRVFEQIGEKIPLSPSEQAVTRRDLTMAGYRSDTAIAVFYGVKVIAAVGAMLFALLVLNSLSDAVDMLVIAVEAGLGLDHALQYVSREITEGHPELADELSLVGYEMRAGKRRSESLRNLAVRTGESELRKLIAILTQSDRFGTSMGESLRTHSDFVRLRRKQDAEERAAKIGVKFVFPVFLFILPSMMRVAAGPVLLKIFTDLFPMMQNSGNEISTTPKNEK